MNYNHRDILRLGLGSVIMSAASAAPFAFAEDGKKIIPVCLQMWSVRNDFKANPAKVLEAIAKMPDSLAMKVLSRLGTDELEVRQGIRNKMLS